MLELLRSLTKKPRPPPGQTLRRRRTEAEAATSKEELSSDRGRRRPKTQQGHEDAIPTVPTSSASLSGKKTKDKSEGTNPELCSLREMAETNNGRKATASFVVG